jgi:hypothetical protein
MTANPSIEPTCAVKLGQVVISNVTHQAAHDVSWLVRGGGTLLGQTEGF